MPILTDHERLGTTIGDGRYRLESVLGRGGMGTVFEAVHEWTGRRVAVKLLRHDVASDFDASQRFLQEARSATAIEHPNVVEVLDMGRHDEWTVYMVFELLRGQSLADRLDMVGRLDPLEAVMILLPVADAVAAAHRLGIVHRDLKPDNIFLEDDGMGYIRPKLLDFGIARASERESGQVRTGVIAGTPEYLSPEHAQGFRAGPAADVWSLGIVLFECITGTRPFEGETVLNVLVAIISNPIPSLRGVSDVPEAIADVVERALVRDPDARIADAEAFRDALAAASEVEFVPSRSRSVPPKILYESGEIALSRAHRVENRQSSPSLGSTPPVRTSTPLPARLSTPSFRQPPLGDVFAGEALEPAHPTTARRVDSDALETVDNLPPVAVGAQLGRDDLPPVVTPQPLASPPPESLRRRSAPQLALFVLVLLLILLVFGYRATRPDGLRATGPNATEPEARSVVDVPSAPASLGSADPSVQAPPEVPVPAAMVRAAATELNAREQADSPRARPSAAPASPASAAEPPAPRTRRSQAGARSTIQRGANGSLILD